MTFFSILTGIIMFIVGLARFMEETGQQILDNTEKQFEKEAIKCPHKARDNWALNMLGFIVLLAGVLALLIWINF